MSTTKLLVIFLTLVLGAQGSSQSCSTNFGPGTKNDCVGSMCAVSCDEGYFPSGTSLPKTCTHALQANPSITSGEYNIHPNDDIGTLTVWCDFDKADGPWTVIQNRVDASVDFYRGWEEYVTGFGLVAGNHWQGLENIYKLTKTFEAELRVDLCDDTECRWAKYSSFSLSGADDNYRLAVSDFSESNPGPGDALAYHNNMQFSTYDADHDSLADRNCAGVNRGAWWYNSCYHSNLNGVYGSTTYEGITWSPLSGSDWYGHDYSMPTARMALKLTEKMFLTQNGCENLDGWRAMNEEECFSYQGSSGMFEHEPFSGHYEFDCTGCITGMYHYGNGVAFNLAENPQCTSEGWHTICVRDDVVYCDDEDAEVVTCEPHTCEVEESPAAGLTTTCGQSLDVHDSCEVSCAPYYMHSDYTFVGHGVCRPEGCDVSDSECQVNGYFMDNSNAEMCRHQCEAESVCVGYAISSDANNSTPNAYRCYVYTSTNDIVVPYGWTAAFSESHFSVFTTSGAENYRCYKAVEDVTEVSTVSCVWEDAAPVLNTASLECVCQEPAMTFVSQELVSSIGSSVLPNGQVDIHVQFPQYLENVLVKFESQEAIEGWNMTDVDCRKVLKKTFELSELQNLATVSIHGAELSFTLFFSATEAFLHEDDGASVTRTVSKPLTFVLSLATNVELSTDLSLHSQLESILALEFNFPYSEFTGTDEEIQACIEADLQSQGVVLLAVQDSNVLGGFRRALSANTDNPNAVIVIAGSQVDMEAAIADLQSGVVQMECMEGAEVLNIVDYTQIVSITSDYSFVSNDDGSSIATIQYSTAINEPWEFTGEYTIENSDMNITSESVSLVQVTDEKSCKVNGEHICEQSWTLEIQMTAEDACSMSEMTFIVSMQSAHGEEVFDGSRVSFDIAVTPNQEDCEQISNLGDVSNVAGVVQVWNSDTEAYEETPTWEIFVGDMVKFQAAVTSELGTLSSVTLTNIRARQESEVCEDCLSEFSEEFEFSCLNCIEDPKATTVVGDSMEFNLRLSRSVFSGTTGTGKATELVFSFDLTYVQGSQRRLLVVLDTQRRRAAEIGDSHVSKVSFGLHDWSRIATPENLDHSEMFVNFLLVVVALLVVVVCLLVYTVISYRSGREKEEYRLTEEQEESPDTSVEQIL